MFDRFLSPRHGGNKLLFSCFTAAPRPGPPVWDHGGGRLDLEDRVFPESASDGLAPLQMEAQKPDWIAAHLFPGRPNL